MSAGETFRKKEAQMVLVSSWIYPQTGPPHQHPNPSFPSCAPSRWSSPGRVPATTEARPCWATRWRSGRSRTSPRAGPWQPVFVKTHPTTSARASGLWVGTASASEPTTPQGSANQARSPSGSRWRLKVRIKLCMYKMFAWIDVVLFT